MSTTKRAVASKYCHWSDSQKIEAVTTYLAVGDLRLSASLLKIPEPTMRLWKSKDWWKEIEGELRLQEDLQLSTRLQRIITKSIDQVEDRLENGDYIYDQKTGQLVRKPVNMKDAHKVAIDMVDKRQILLNRNPVQMTAEGIDDKLLKLAERFAQLATGVKPPIQVTDVIYVESEHGEDERGSTDGDGGSGTDTLGSGIDQYPDGVLEGGDTEGAESPFSPNES